MYSSICRNLHIKTCNMHSDIVYMYNCILSKTLRQAIYKFCLNLHNKSINLKLYFVVLCAIRQSIRIQLYSAETSTIRQSICITAVCRKLHNKTVYMYDCILLQHKTTNIKLCYYCCNLYNNTMNIKLYF